jgi:hypothetical protein
MFVTEWGGLVVAREGRRKRTLPAWASCGAKTSNCACVAFTEKAPLSQIVRAELGGRAESFARGPGSQGQVFPSTTPDSFGPDTRNRSTAVNSAGSTIFLWFDARMLEVGVRRKATLAELDGAFAFHNRERCVLGPGGGGVILHTVDYSLCRANAVSISRPESNGFLDPRPSR